MKVYVASSWRNAIQPRVVDHLGKIGIDCYDFRNPGGGRHGFKWSDVMTSYVEGTEQVTEEEYLKALDHPVAEAGFSSDFRAMEECDTCVLVLPCGRSAHLEAGWFIGQGKKVVILLDGPVVTPELMYKMADALVVSIPQLAVQLLIWTVIETQNQIDDLKNEIAKGGGSA